MSETSRDIKITSYLLERIMAFGSRLWHLLLKFYYFLIGAYPPTNSFEQKIQQLSDFNLEEIVENFDAKHAAIVIERIYLKAAIEKKKIRHLTGHFDPVVYKDYPNVLAALKKCVRNKVEISVIVTEREKFDSNKIEFVKLIENYASINYSSESMTQEPHMLLVGDHGSVFRYETNPSTHNGKVSFNCPSLGGGFVDSFDSLFDSLTPPKAA